MWRWKQVCQSLVLRKFMSSVRRRVDRSDNRCACASKFNGNRSATRPEMPTLLAFLCSAHLSVADGNDFLCSWPGLMEPSCYGDTSKDDEAGALWCVRPHSDSEGPVAPGWRPPCTPLECVWRRPENWTRSQEPRRKPGGLRETAARCKCPPTSAVQTAVDPHRAPFRRRSVAVSDGKLTSVLSLSV